MRVATYNIEWFSELFDKHDNLLLDADWSHRYNVTRKDQAEAIAAVLQKLDADLILIVEAPNTGHSQDSLRALNRFTKHFGLRQNASAMGYANATHQELVVLYDPQLVEVTHDPQGAYSDGTHTITAPRFDGKFRYDVDVDGKPEVFSFSKPPIELQVTDLPSGNSFRLIGVHTKSKAPHGATNPTEELQLAIENRRKQLAQCIWIRQRVEATLTAGDPLIVLGDFNDGPGVNGYENLFARSGVEIVMGEVGDTQSLFEPHAQMFLDPRQGWSLASSRFYINKYKRYMNALLDYVMVSPDLNYSTRAKWRIWHPFDDPECFENPDMQHALLTASDHFPVSVDLHF